MKNFIALSIICTIAFGCTEQPKTDTVPLATTIIPRAMIGVPSKAMANNMTAYVVDVIRVIDGDTVVVEFNVWPDVRLRKTIRFANIDTWEMRGANKVKGKAAKAFLEALLAKGEVALHTNGSTGKYGRTIGSLYVADNGRVYSVAEELIKNGHQKE